jgi:hypothetical protein
MQQLDSKIITAGTKWPLYLLLIYTWGMTIADYEKGTHKFPIAWYYVLPAVTVLMVYFFSSLKRVWLDGDILIIRGFNREANVPVSTIEKIRPFGQFITIVFKSKTAFGRRVTIMTGNYGRDRVAKVLRAAMEGKNVGVKVSHVPHNAASNIAAKEEIIVSGWTDQELPGILADFVEPYDDRLDSKFDFQIEPYDKGASRITFPHGISAEIFSFLVNYLQYPKNYDLTTRSVLVIGKAVLTPGFHPPDKNLIGQKAMFYIPSNDQKYDQVYIRVANETFVNSFAARHWKKVSDPSLPAGVEI